MNRKQFTEQVVQKRINKIRDVLDSKADEYASDSSAFYNFERLGEIERRKPKESLWSLAGKHLVCIIDMVESDELFSDDYIDEKIGDMINYLILLEGILKSESKCCGDWDDLGNCKEICKK